MSHHSIKGSTALVTGANRGIGRAVVEELLERGVAKVYAGARRTEDLADLVNAEPERVVPVELDVTDGDQIDAVAARAGDIDLLINNAGVAIGGWLGDASLEANARQEMEVNYFGPLRLLDRLAPFLIEKPQATVVNVASVAGLTNFPVFVTYSASKAAVHSLTQGARMLMGPGGVSVIGVYPGPVDTDLAKDVPMEKASPRSVAIRILDGVEAGEEDIFTDDFATDFAQTFLGSPKASEQQFAAFLAESA